MSKAKRTKPEPKLANPGDPSSALTGDLVADEESPYYWANWAPSHKEIAETHEVSIETVKMWARKGMPGKTKNGYSLPRIQRWLLRQPHNRDDLIGWALRKLDQADEEDATR